MRRLLGIGLVLLALLSATTATTATTAVGEPRAQALSTKTHLFYYPWYGGASTGYRHWTQGGHTPPSDVGADLYPVLGAYDSGDTAVVDQHMAWIQRSGAGTIVVSWWGQGSYEDTLVPRLLDAAARYGIKVAFHLEPYGTRTAASTVADIDYINARYGGHSAFYRDAEHGNRGAFYVFESLRITDWTALEQVKAHSIVLAQTTDTSKVAHFGGMYTYDAIAGATAPGWAGASAFCKANGLVWAPSIGPGYVDDRAVPGNTTPTLARDNGAAYDKQWGNALGSNADWVSVTSFNEWHEGSVIEPARSTPPAGQGYQTFEGAYGKTGAAAETAYLDRTAYWTQRFGGGTPPPANANLAAGKPVSATGSVPGYAPANATDGNQGSYWESTNGSFPQSLTVDLGATATVGRVVLKLPPSWGARTQTLSVLGSATGSTYSTLVASRGYDFAPTATIAVPSATTRFLRLTFTGNTGWPAGQVAELEAYTT